MVHEGKLYQHGGLELVLLIDVEGLTLPHHGEDSHDLLVGVVVGVGPIESVIAETASMLVEGVMSLIQGHQVGGKIFDLDIGQLGQPIDPFVEDGDILGGHAPVRPPGRVHGHLIVRLGQHAVVVEGIERVFGGAD